MNLEQFQVLLQKAIDNSNNTTDYLLLSKAIQSLGVGQVREVATYANLPSAASNEGLLVFVTADEEVYWSTGTAWYGLSLENEGFSYSWGQGSFGKLGDNSTTNKSSPITITGGFSDWCNVSAGYDHSLGIAYNGSAWAWGLGSAGRLGDNSVVSSSSPVSVVGGFTDWRQLSAGGAHSLGVRQSGTLYAWGCNSFAQLGDNTTVNKSSPVSVVGGFTDWCQLSAGFRHSLAVRCNGTAWAWGAGYRGRLGDGTSTDKSSPVSVVGGFTDWCQLSAGAYHSVAVRCNGTAWAWGRGTCGRLGDNTNVDKSSPVSVVGGFIDWCQVSAGVYHSVAIRQNGTAWTWGSAASGSLGNNTIVSKSSPVSVVGGFTDWCQVSAGRDNNLGIRRNGTAWAWGKNYCGSLGDNTTVNKSSPVSVVGGFTDWCQVSGGNYHSLAIRTTNFV